MVLLENEGIPAMIGSRQGTMATNNIDRHMKTAMMMETRVAGCVVTCGRQASGYFELPEGDWKRDQLARVTDLESTDDNFEQPYRILVQ